jgi:predicted nucleic acid-binding protein
LILIVIDASAVLELLLRTQRASAVEEWVFAANETLHAPHLLDVEVAQVLRRYYLHQALSSRRAGQALEDLALLGLARYPHEPLMSGIWRLRDNFSAYDAAYVVLAEALGAPLLTCDSRLANAPGTRATIHCLS